MLNAPSSAFGLTSALVHRSAASSLSAGRRHAAFITTRLGIGFAALACAPPFLVLHGAPTALETLAFAFSLAPLAASAFAAWTGRLSAAHGIAGLGLVGFGLTLWLGLGYGVACAVTWLLVANIEAWLSANRLVSRTAGALTAALLACMATTALTLAVPLPQNAAGATIFAALALVYGWIVCGHIPNAEKRGREARDSETRDLATDAEASTWQAISEAIDDVVIAFDSGGRVERVRSDAAIRLGVPTSALAGRGFFEQIHADDRQIFLKTMSKAAGCDETIVARLRLHGKIASRQIDVRARRTKPSDHALDSTRIVAIVRTVEERPARPMEAVAAEDATQTKDHCLASMSHELRTPLNAIIGFSEMLGSHTMCPADTAKQREYAHIIHQSGTQLLSLVDSILDASRARAGLAMVDSESDDTAIAEIDTPYRHLSTEPAWILPEQRMKEVA